MDEGKIHRDGRRDRDAIPKQGTADEQRNYNHAQGYAREDRHHDVCMIPAERMAGSFAGLQRQGAVEQSISQIHCPDRETERQPGRKEEVYVNCPGKYILPQQGHERGIQTQQIQP